MSITPAHKGRLPPPSLGRWCAARCSSPFPSCAKGGDKGGPSIAASAALPWAYCPATLRYVRCSKPVFVTNVTDTVWNQPRLVHDKHADLIMVPRQNLVSWTHQEWNWLKKLEYTVTWKESQTLEWEGHNQSIWYNIADLSCESGGQIVTSSCCCITPIQVVQTSVKLKMSVDTLWLIRVRDTALVKKKKKQFKIS
jgi:hypothetical protein